MYVVGSRGRNRSYKDSAMKRQTDVTINITFPLTTFVVRNILRNLFSFGFIFRIRRSFRDGFSKDVSSLSG